MYLYIELYSEIVLSPVSNKCFVKLNLGFTDIGVQHPTELWRKKNDFFQQILSGEKKRVVRLSAADFFHNSFFFHMFFP